MKKIWEGFKDIIYDSTDYFIMIAIVGIVACVIVWRLDLLFGNNVVSTQATINIIAEKEDSNEEKVDVINSKENKEKVDIVESKENKEAINPDKDKIIKIIIPTGSLPSSIGTILETNGLVSSEAEFVKKSKDMKLDKKLKSGNYEIKTNTTMEEIVQLLTK